MIAFTTLIQVVRNENTFEFWGDINHVYHPHIFISSSLLS
jgi:hypothetical protein